MNRKLAIGLLFQSVPLKPLKNGEFAKTQDVVLVPQGVSTLRDGSRILCDKAGSQAAVDDFTRHGTDIPFDKNHSTALKLPKGEEAPSFGWGKKLWFKEGVGLMCEAHWTDEGYEDIKAGRYRYLSPVIGYVEATGQVRQISSVALTTLPATPQMPALAATYVLSLQERDSMDGLLKKLLQEGEAVVATAEQKMGELKALLESKGAELGDGVDFVGILNAAMKILKGEGDGEESADAKANAEVAASVRTELGLPSGADKNLILRKLTEVKGHIGYVPADEHKKLTERLTTLEEKDAKRTADDLVDAYLTEGKLLETNDEQMKWARAAAANDPEGFKVIMATAPVVVPQGRTKAPSGASDPTNSDAGNEEKLIAAALTEHKGNHKDAMVALQTKLMTEQTATGLTREAARERCTELYPKIFGKVA